MIRLQRIRGKPNDANDEAERILSLSADCDRRGNTALWRIAMTRLTCDPRPRDYVQRRTTEGLSKREIPRCLKRYIAREVLRTLPRATLDTP